MIEEKKIIRIFLAVADDAGEERKSFEKVIKEFNEPYGPGSKVGVEFETLYWSDFLEHYIKNEKKRDFEGELLKAWDILIGILRFKFDQPQRSTGHRQTFPKGSKLTFENACKAWKKEGKPRIIIFRSHRDFSIRIDYKRYKEVQHFFGTHSGETRKPIPYRTFKETQDFEEYLTQFLQKILDDRKREGYLKVYTKNIHQEVPEDEWREREMVLLRVNSLLHNPRLEQRHFDNPELEQHHFEAVAELLDKYNQFTTPILRGYNGIRISWTIEGSIWGFHRGNFCDNAIRAGLDLVRRQEEFNSQLEEPFANARLKTRIAAEWKQPCRSGSQKIAFPDYRNAVVHLEKNHAPPGGFVITPKLYREISKSLTPFFDRKRNEDGSLLFVFAPQYTEPLSSTTLINIETHIADNIEVLSESLQVASIPGSPEPDFEEFRGLAGRIYNNYINFYQDASKYNPEWPDDYFTDLSSYIQSVLTADKRLAEKLDDLRIELKKTVLGKPGVQYIKQFISSLRINPVTDMNLLLRKTKRLPENIETDAVLEEYMNEKITAFTGSGDFDEETAFAEFFLTPELKQKFGSCIAGQHKNQSSSKFIQRFWKLADFVCIEDYYENDVMLIPLILNHFDKHTEPAVQKFELVGQIVNENILPGKEPLEMKFKKMGITPSPQDIDIVLKCLLVKHPSKEIKEFAVNNLDFKELWNIIAYSKTPLPVLVIIAQQRLIKEDRLDPDDRIKVFFTLIRSSLLNILFNEPKGKRLDYIKSILDIFLGFNSLSEDSYFKRLSDLVDRFKENAGGLELKAMEDARKCLEKSAAQRVNVEEEKLTPKCLNDLPLAVQRKLAHEGEYLDFFCLSENSGIAREVSHHISDYNVKRFLFKDGISSAFKSAVFIKKHLFKDKNWIKEVLKHACCTVQFATLYATTQYFWLNELIEMVEKRSINYTVINTVKNYIEKMEKG